MHARVVISVFAGALTILVAGCYRDAVRTAELRVPALRHEEASAIVDGALAQAFGVIEIDIQREHERVLVTYDPRVTALRNLELVLASEGLDANSMPATPQGRARLPASLRTTTNPTPETTP